MLVYSPPIRFHLIEYLILSTEEFKTVETALLQISIKTPLQFWQVLQRDSINIVGHKRGRSAASPFIVRFASHGINS